MTRHGLGHVQRAGGVGVDDVRLLVAVLRTQMDGGHADHAVLRLQHRDLQEQGLGVVGDARCARGILDDLGDLVGVDAHGGIGGQRQHRLVDFTVRRGLALGKADVEGVGLGRGAGAEHGHGGQRLGGVGDAHGLQPEVERLSGADGAVVDQLVQLGDGYLGDVLIDGVAHCDGGPYLGGQRRGGQPQCQYQRQQQGKAFFHT